MQNDSARSGCVDKCHFSTGGMKRSLGRQRQLKNVNIGIYGEFSGPISVIPRTVAKRNI